MYTPSTQSLAESVEKLFGAVARTAVVAALSSAEHPRICFFAFCSWPVVGRPQARQTRQGLGLAALGPRQLPEILRESHGAGAERGGGGGERGRSAELCLSGRLWKAFIVELQKLRAHHLQAGAFAL